jgi:hypothetical protein
MADYNLVHKNDFKEFWKRLNNRDIHNVRQQVDVLQEKGKADSTIIRNLQKRPKLKEKWQAKRAFVTESKRLQSIDERKSAIDRGVKKFTIILEPNACEKCKAFARGGKRIFTEKGIGKGNEIVIPHHPNCKCQLVAIV